jgi:GT2 family glycosyltransferase
VGEVSGAALLIRKSLYEKIGGFDEKIFAYYEDVDLCKRAHDAGYEVCYVPTAKVIHLWKRSSKAVPELVYRASQDSTRHYFHKHHGWAAHVAVQLMLAGKELILWLSGTLRKKIDAPLHRRMLARALSPLP